MNLLDQYGNEIKHNKPVLNEIAIQAVHSRFSSYPSNGLTPERLAKILREADQGNMLRQAELFEEMEEKNCHLGCVLGTRKLAPCGLDWEILPASSSVEDKKNADEAKEFIEYIENWEDGILNIMDAVGKGWSVNEIMWDNPQGQGKDLANCPANIARLVIRWNDGKDPKRHPCWPFHIQLVRKCH